ncbi:hypothetical protein E2562_018717 [Oryza meyeriana var. granulata]|uniref:F-box associated domain-containing protein n=1 Tax=Oryza meyeriana var. granulata TaxID=110450 RepID=A0A6G1EMR5_9ORYZ|nr:hypothetical protein E2562_018717 [Oryza meyeriana var. granulata]
MELDVWATLICQEKSGWAFGPRVRVLKPPPTGPPHGVVNSFSGLLLCRCFESLDSFRYVVCNPAMEEWVALPESGYDMEDEEELCTRLGFDPAVCSHFRVFEFVMIRMFDACQNHENIWGKCMSFLIKEFRGSSNVLMLHLSLKQSNGNFVHSEGTEENLAAVMHLLRKRRLNILLQQLQLANGYGSPSSR